MGKSYRGVRKQFGAKKTQDHRTRRKWSSENGTRLRTLVVDIAEFQEFAGAGAESLHRPLSEKKQPEGVRPSTSASKSRWEFLNSLDTSELEVKKAYAAKQAAHLQQILVLLQWDTSAKPVIVRLSARKKFWDTQTGTIGPILAERAKKTAHLVLD